MACITTGMLQVLSCTWSRFMRLGLKKLSCAVDFIKGGIVWDGFKRSPAVADFGFGNVRNSLVRHEIFGHACNKVVVSPLNNSGVVGDFKVDRIVD